MFGRSDLPLRGDASSRYLPWLVAIMVYLASLALAAALLAHGALERWDRTLAGSITVQVPPTAGEAGEAAALAEVLRILRVTPGLGAPRVLDREHAARLLEPWLGATLLETLPVPLLVDVAVERPDQLDLAALATRVAAAAPGATVDDHRPWLDELLAVARSAAILAGVVVALVGTAAALTVMVAVRSGLAVHREVIEVLHLIGARDSYIAAQFQWHALRLATIGGLVGLVLAAATLIGTGWLVVPRAGAVGVAKLLAGLAPRPLDWLALLLAPLGGALVTLVTARLSVMRALARLP